MNCIEEGVLRTKLDGELGASELSEVNQHLAECGDCRFRLEKLSAEKARTAKLLMVLNTSIDGATSDAAIAYAQFRTQFETDERNLSWVNRVLALVWRPAWGLAAAVTIVAMFLGLNPMRTWAQRVLAMLRVQKIAVVTIDPSTLMTGSEPNSRPYKVFNQFISDNVVTTMDPGKPQEAANIAAAEQLAGYPVRTISSLGAPQRIEVNGEAAFQMSINRGRMETLLDEVGRPDIRIPESANGALIAVHIPKIVTMMYGDCPARHREGISSTQLPTEDPTQRKMERVADNENASCTYLIQAASPTVSIPPDLKMSEIAEAALELAGMNSAEAHSFCQTVDWSTTLVVPIPHDTSSYKTVTVEGVEGTLITENLPRGNRYSLLWVKNGVVHSLAGGGSPSDALTLAASLQ